MIHVETPAGCAYMMYFRILPEDDGAMPYPVPAFVARYYARLRERRLEEERRKAARDIENGMSYKDEILCMMAHEVEKPWYSGAASVSIGSGHPVCRGMAAAQPELEAMGYRVSRYMGKHDWSITVYEEGYSRNDLDRQADVEMREEIRALLPPPLVKEEEGEVEGDAAQGEVVA